MQRWLSKQAIKSVQVCLEATHVYWEEVAEFVYEQGYPVNVVNLVRVSGFALSQLRRNITDPLDSGVIAQFCAALKPGL